MQNPVFRNKNYTLGYLIAWGIIALGHIFLSFFFSSLGIYVSIIESIIQTGVFALVGVLIWYPVYFTDPEKNRIMSFITNHIASCSLSVGLWMWLTTLTLSAIFKNNIPYSQAFEASIASRLAIGFLLYLLVSTNYYLYIYYDSFREKQTREAELKTLVKEIELNSLKSQINPHFLFNSLNSISSLTMFSPERAQEMVINLSDFLRYSLSHGKETLTSFERELVNLDRYLSIEKIRFGKRLHVEKRIQDDCTKLRLPGLILQPIMENAIKYGVYESTDQSNIRLESKCNPNLLTVRITNDYDPDYVSKKGEGIGLRNVRSRLQLLYSRNDLLIINKEERTFEVLLHFPQN